MTDRDSTVDPEQLLLDFDDPEETEPKTVTEDAESDPVETPHIVMTEGHFAWVRMVQEARTNALAQADNAKQLAPDVDRQLCDAATHCLEEAYDFLMQAVNPQVRAEQ